MIRLVVGIIVVLIFLASGGSHGQAQVIIIPTPTETPIPAGDRADRCEPNNRLSQPCSLPVGVMLGEWSFPPGDERDVYSFLFEANTEYSIRAQSADGIATRLTLYRADDLETPLAQGQGSPLRNPDGLAPIDSQIIYLSEERGWHIVVVDRISPVIPQAVYQFGALITGPVNLDDPTPIVSPPPTLVPEATYSAGGDAYENNYDVRTAQRIPLGVPLDLSLRCPEANACRDGDHDFFWVSVKRNVPIAAITYDLGPGVDTRLTLYMPGPSDDANAPVGWKAVIANDDIAPGWTLRSSVIYTPTIDGTLLLVVSPSDRADPPRVMNDTAEPGRYRMIVGPVDLAIVQEILAIQDDLPPVTPTPTMPIRPTSIALTLPTTATIPLPTAISPQDTIARRPIEGDCQVGVARVIGAGVRMFRVVPPLEGDQMGSVLTEGTLVALLGDCHVGYVKGQPLRSASPGWFWEATLRVLLPNEVAQIDLTQFPPPIANELARTYAPTPTVQAQSGGGSSSSSRPVPGSSVLPGPNGGIQLVEPPTPTPVPIQSVAPVARELSIAVCVRTRSGCNAPALAPAIEIFVASTGERLTVERAGADGRVKFVLAVPPQSALVLQIPMYSFRVPIEANARDIKVEIPGGVND